MKIINFLIIISFIGLLACKKDNDNIDPNDKGKIVIKLDNFMYDRKIIFNYYMNQYEDIAISKLQYYLSNFKFKKADGSEYVYPKDKSYFLIKETGTSTSTILNFEDVPAADYVGLSFIIGVDSLKSVSPIAQRSGVLDPNGNDMYWSFDAGYIFLKLEGSSTRIPPDINNYRNYRFHIGGYGGYDSPTINNLRIVNLSTNPEVAQVRKNLTPTIILSANIYKIFNGKTIINLTNTPEVLFTPYSLNISENYSKMFQYLYLYTE